MRVSSIAEIRSRYIRDVTVSRETTEDARPPRMPWSEDDLNTMERMRTEGIKTRVIADHLGRSHGAVRAKLTRKRWTVPHNKRGALCL
nr:hypothetical protein [uncultured Dongia sp.]